MQQIERTELAERVSAYCQFQYLSGSILAEYIYQPYVPENKKLKTER